MPRTKSPRSRRWIVIGGLVFAGTAANLLVSPDPSGRATAPPTAITVTQAQYGDDWPFPRFASGQIRCTRLSRGGVTRPVVTITMGGTEYGLNGAAFGFGGYPDSREEMKRDPATGAFASGAHHTLIQRGLKLCER